MALRPPLVAGFLFLLLPAPCLPAETMLIGKVGSAEILGVSPEWQRQYDAYAPAAGDLKAFSDLPRRTSMDVYFGSWCGDSREGVPHMIRILHDAPSNRLKVRYYAVDRSKREPSGAAAEAAVLLVPTFILKVRGREIGRIVETPETTMEHDLARLIQRAALPQAP
jgi:thiol-disulfide isomerase/thioredoxin